jgi:hypothetical protein
MRRIFLMTAVALTAPWVLLFTVLLLLSLGGDLVTLAKSAVREGDKKGRHELPAYQDKRLAMQIYEDAKRTLEAYAPYVGWRREAMASKTVNIAANGLRQHKLGRDNIAKSPTIGFFGGSLVWGTGAADDGTIPALFDQITTRFVIINYGEGSWTSRQSLALLVNLIREDRAPDIVVFYGGVANNVDIGCNLAFGERLSSHRHAPAYSRLVADAASPSYLYRNFWVPLTDTIRRVLGRSKPGQERVCDKDKQRAVAIAEALLRDWEMAKLLTESVGGQFFAFLPPVAGVGAPRLDHLSLDAGRLAQFAPVYEAIRRLMVERAKDWSWDLPSSPSACARLSR